ncbi:MAG: hypothetical protein KDD53_07340, partial [Bdellovibrionales bacterium]|nr:hypothetical protein [Bdellovibrionales bacterium]
MRKERTSSEQLTDNKEATPRVFTHRKTFYPQLHVPMGKNTMQSFPDQITVYQSCNLALGYHVSIVALSLKQRQTIAPFRWC